MRAFKAFVACLLTLVLILGPSAAVIADTPENFVYLPLILTPPGSCGSAPTLISPTDGSSSQPLIPTFKWENGDVTEVTEVSLFLSLQEDDFPDHWEYWVTSSNRYFEEEQYDRDNLDPDTTYYWQVWLKCGEVESPHSEVWSFTTGSDGLILPAPTLVSPENGAEIWSSMLPITLDWLPVDGATKYKVILSRYDSGMWLISYTRTVTDSQFLIPISLFANTYYRWTIQPMNDYAISPSSSFTFKTMD